MGRLADEEGQNPVEHRTSALQIYTLGSLRLVLNGQDLTGFATYKTPLLIAYLAHMGKSVDRATVAELLYPVSLRAQALANLRTVLNNMKARNLDQFLSVSRDRISIIRREDIWIDTEILEAAIQTEDLDSAITVYGGDFLERIVLDIVKDKDSLSSWIVDERRRLRMTYIAVLNTMLEHTFYERNFLTSIDYAAKLLRLEPTHEIANLYMMRSLAGLGCLSEAVLHYQRYYTLLGTRNLAPSSALAEAYEAIIVR